MRFICSSVVALAAAISVNAAATGSRAAASGFSMQKAPAAGHKSTNGKAAAAHQKAQSAPAVAAAPASAPAAPSTQAASSNKGSNNFPASNLAAEVVDAALGRRATATTQDTADKVKPLTNAAALQNGGKLLKPVRRAPGAILPRQSPTPGNPGNPGNPDGPDGPNRITLIGNIFCSGNNGVEGFVSEDLNQGAYTLEEDQEDAARVRITFQNQTGVVNRLNIRNTNPGAPYPFLGGVTGIEDQSSDIDNGSSNFGLIAATDSTPRGARPTEDIDNSYADESGDDETFVESSIWTLNPSTGELTLQWINSVDGDARNPETFLILVDGALGFTGDYGEFSDVYFQFEKTLLDCAFVQNI